MTSKQRKSIKRNIAAQKMTGGPSLRMANYASLQSDCAKFGVRSATFKNADDKVVKRFGLYS